MNIISGSVEELAKGLPLTLVEKERKEFHVAKMTPQDDKVKYSSTRVNINSKDIDRDEVEMYCGMDENFDAEEFAAACVEYYGERFWGGGTILLDKEEAEEKANKLIS